MRRDSTAYSAVRPAYDKNDCVIRAVALVTGCTYQQASAISSAAGRQLKKGTPMNTSRKVNTDWLGMQEMPEVASWPLAAFIAAHPEGRYLVYKHGHAVAVIDGVLHDWEATRTTARSVILHVWRPTEKTQERLTKIQGLFA